MTIYRVLNLNYAVISHFSAMQMNKEIRSEGQKP